MSLIKPKISEPTKSATTVPTIAEVTTVVDPISLEDQVKIEKDRINKEIEGLKHLVGKPGYNVFTYVREVVNPVLNSNNLETLRMFHAVEEGCKT